MATTLEQFGKDMKSASRKLNNEIRAGLRDAGKAAATDMRILIAPYSKKIPPTIRVNTSKMYTVTITIGGPGIPETILLEMGNKGREGATTFRHPVFAPKDSHGDSSVPWVDQPEHPYVAPVVTVRGPLVAQMMQDALAKSIVGSKE